MFSVQNINSFLTPFKIKLQCIKYCLVSSLSVIYTLTAYFCYFCYIDTKLLNIQDFRA